MKKKIILCIYSLRNGGAERVMINMANSFLANGHAVTILTIGKAESGYALNPGIEIRELKLASQEPSLLSSVKNLFKRIQGIYRQFQEVKPDICVSFMTETNIMSLLAGLMAGVPVIISERTNPKKHRVASVYQALRRITYKYALHVVLQTQGVRNFYATQFNLKNLTIIPNPIRLDYFTPGSGEREKTIISVGRFTEEKGHLLLIEAFAISDAMTLGWKLSIVGSGPLEHELKAKAGELGISEYVNFEGLVSHVAAKLQTAGIFVLPSRYEGFPNALMEALACGVPSISSNCDFGPSDIIVAGENGLLANTGDQADLKTKLNLLLNDEDLRIKFQVTGPESVKRFEYNQVMNQWEKIISLT